MENNEEVSFEDRHYKTMKETMKRLSDKFSSTEDLRLWGDERVYYNARHSYFSYKSKHAESEKDKKKYEKLALEAFRFCLFDLRVPYFSE